MPALSIVMPFYMNAAMLRRHFEEWASYPPELLNDIEAVIVNHGSPAPEANACSCWRDRRSAAWPWGS